MNEETKTQLETFVLSLKKEDYSSYLKVILNCIGIKQVLLALVKCLEEFDTAAGATPGHFLELRTSLQKIIDETNQTFTK